MFLLHSKKKVLQKQKYPRCKYHKKETKTREKNRKRGSIFYFYIIRKGSYI